MTSHSTGYVLRMFCVCVCFILQASCLSGASDSAGSGTLDAQSIPGDAKGSDAPETATVASTDTVITGEVPAGPWTGLPYTFVGRFDASNPNVWRFKFGGSKIGATFTGTTLAVNIKDTGTDLFNVVIDGGPRIILTVNPNDAALHTITQALPQGTHTVWMTKRTESFSGYTALPGLVSFQGFVIDANASFLKPPAPKNRVIVASGDSGFTGWGGDTVVTGGSSTCSGSDGTLANEDNSIPAQTAVVAGAEIVNLSVSGEGIVESVVDTNPSHQLPVVFDEVLPPLGAPLYDYANGVPADVVLLSAGGDDLFGDYGNGVIHDPNLFVSTYVKWLQHLRGVYPKAFIIVGLSKSAAAQDKITLKNLYSQAIAQAAPNGDPNLVYYDVWEGTSWTTYNDAAAAGALAFYWGCSGHPSPAGAQYLGNRYGTFIKQHMGWK